MGISARKFNNKNTQKKNPLPSPTLTQHESDAPYLSALRLWPWPDHLLASLLRARTSPCSQGQLRVLLASPGHDPSPGLIALRGTQELSLLPSSNRKQPAGANRVLKPRVRPWFWLHPRTSASDRGCVHGSQAHSWCPLGGGGEWGVGGWDAGWQSTGNQPPRRAPATPSCGRWALGVLL